MAEIFLQKDVQSLLKNKNVVLLGDSNVRALYKDLVWLFKCNSLIDPNFLKRRLENQFLGDNLVHRSELTRGRDFTEHRKFNTEGTQIEFIFITRCYSKIIEELFQDIKNGKREAPDVIYMNSCLWDISRWGPNGVKEYQVNMRNLMKLLTQTIPNKTMFIWGTSIPTASNTSGGLIIKQLEFLQAALRVHVMEANKFTSALVSSYGFDVLDFHYFMHYQVCRRSADGIHFLPHAMRFMTNLLLTHIALSWDVKLPQRITIFPGPLEKVLRAANQVSTNKVEGMVQKIENIASNLNNTVEPQNTGNSSQRRKNKKKNKKNNRLRYPQVQQSLPMYHKAPKHAFSSQLSCGASSSVKYSNNYYQENAFNHASTARSNERSGLNKFPSNYCNYYNDPYKQSTQEWYSQLSNTSQLYIPLLICNVNNPVNYQENMFIQNAQNRNYFNDYGQSSTANGVTFNTAYSEQRFVSYGFPSNASSRNWNHNGWGGGAMRPSGNKGRRYTPYGFRK